MNKFMQDVIDARYRSSSHNWYTSGMDQFQGPFELTNQWDISDNVGVYGNPAWMNAATDYVNGIAGQNTVAPWADTYQHDRIGTLNYVKNPEYNAFLGGRGDLQSRAPGYTDDSIAGYFKEAFSDPAQIKNRNDAIRNLRIWNENAGNGGVGLNKATDPMTKQYFDELRLNELYGLDGSRFNPPPPALPQPAPMPQPAPISKQTPIEGDSMSKGGSMGPDGEYIPGTPPQGPPQGAPPVVDTSISDPRFLTDPTVDVYGNQMPATGGVRGDTGLVSAGMLPRPQPGFGASRLSMAPGFNGGIGGLFNQLAYMPEENFARSMDRYQQFNDQYGSAMGPRNPMNSMNMFSQFGRMDDDQFNMGMNRYQQYRDMFPSLSSPVRPDPRPLPPGMNPDKPAPIPFPTPDIFTVSPAQTDQSGGDSMNPNQAPQYFNQFGPNRNPYARGYGMGYQPSYQPSYQPPYMPQQGPLSYNQGPSKGSPGPGMSYMSPAGQQGYGAFGGGQGYYSPSRPSAPAGGSKGGTGGSSPSGKGGSA